MEISISEKISLFATMETKRINPMQGLKIHIDDSKDKEQAKNKTKYSEQKMGYLLFAICDFGARASHFMSHVSKIDGHI